jgi:hypothetical protein
MNRTKTDHTQDAISAQNGDMQLSEGMYSKLPIVGPFTHRAKPFLSQAPALLHPNTNPRLWSVSRRLLRTHETRRFSQVTKTLQTPINKEMPNSLFNPGVAVVYAVARSSASGGDRGTNLVRSCVDFDPILLHGLLSSQPNFWQINSVHT